MAQVVEGSLRVTKQIDEDTIIPISYATAQDWIDDGWAIFGGSGGYVGTEFFRELISDGDGYHTLRVNSDLTALGIMMPSGYGLSGIVIPSSIKRFGYPLRLNEVQHILANDPCPCDAIASFSRRNVQSGIIA